MLILRIQKGEQPEEQRRFEKPEISFGRDPANDVSFRGDGSVSKFHALLAKTKNGIILTDLKSTNGTLLNGAPIQGPAAVGESDEIGIGEAIIRVDFAAMNAGRQKHRPTPVPVFPPSQPPIATAEGRGLGPPARKRRQRVSEPPAPNDTKEGADGQDALGKTARRPALRRPSETPKSDITEAEAQIPTVRPPSPETGEALHAHVRALAERVTKAMNIDLLLGPGVPNDDTQRWLEDVLRTEVASLDVPESTAKLIVATVREEFVGIGPLGPWLDDPEITKIQCLDWGRVDLIREGSVVRAEFAFSSDAATQQALVRLAFQAGHPKGEGERVLKRRLRSGGQLIALFPPLAHRTCFTIHKPVAIVASMRHLEGERVLTREMANVLARSMQARANMLVVGDSESSLLRVLAALADAAPPSHRLAVLHAGSGIDVDDRQVVSYGLPVLADEQEAALRGALLLGYDHTLAVCPNASAAARAARAVGPAGSGVVVGFPARTLQSGWQSMAGELMLHTPSLDYDAAVALMGRNIDVVVEVGRITGGQSCILRIAEIETVNDVQRLIGHDDQIRSSRDGDRKDPAG